MPDFIDATGTHSYDLLMLAAGASCKQDASAYVQTGMCRWLLRMHELVGNCMPLTHEFLSQMSGVRRTSVTELAGDMQRAGMISYTRGRLHTLSILSSSGRTHRAG